MPPGWFAWRCTAIAGIGPCFQAIEKKEKNFIAAGAEGVVVACMRRQPGRVGRITGHVDVMSVLVL
ncbi:hypothetical protein LHK_01408 [Laribacter hongkongensis HLHK9]|uniref:Uncharacterized protein n=1 Tax=Laribacter hongkongensis (strain HLHK9) TaxID=557598 RepID=C1D7F8_LARHH|nr:hypothetical protein LHK_01408 [Laribacter hongkongensis HLHK9]